MSFGSRFDKLDLGRGRRAANRVVVPPMASETAGADGVATAATVDRYARLASSGAGLVFVEYTFVDWSGRSEPNQLGLTSDGHAAALAPVLAAIKARGAVAGLQLTHCGGKTTRDLTGGVLQGPSDVAVPVKDRVTEPTTPMTPDEIRAWKAAFVAAAERGAALGFDVVELHAAHGYGLNQWLSPVTNRRSDEYGGEHEGRARSSASSPCRSSASAASRRALTSTRW
jgi:NADPH2 dehydrogenase